MKARDENVKMPHMRRTPQTKAMGTSRQSGPVWCWEAGQAVPEEESGTQAAGAQHVTGCCHKKTQISSLRSTLVVYNSSLVVNKIAIHLPQQESGPLCWVLGSGCHMLWARFTLVSSHRSLTLKLVKDISSQKSKLKCYSAKILRVPRRIKIMAIS